MRVVVNMNVCESNAICSGIVPEVFEVNDDDQLVVLIDEPDESFRDRIMQAVYQCPKQAISLQDS